MTAEAAAGEAATTTTQPVIDALIAAELFWLLVPRDLGGLETDICTTLAVFEELARADGSTGWSVMANATSSCFAAIYTGEAAAKAMFGDGARSIHAGMLGPVGKARRVDGGWQVSGRYQFGSGCAHSSFIGAGTVEVDDDGEQVTAPSGLPAMRVVLVPRDLVEFRGNWDVLGLQGTGSYDYALDDVFVPDDFTYSLLEHTQRRGGPGCRVGLFAITAAGHAGFALGVGRRALDEIVALSNDARPNVGLRDDRDRSALPTRLRVARLRVARGASTCVRRVCGRRSDGTSRGRGHSRPATAAARRGDVRDRVAAEATRFAYSWAGSAGLRPGAIQRCFRDIHTGTQHIYVDNNTMTGYAQAVISDM